MTDDITLKLLNWYDSEKRILPWRNLDRKKIDPYRVWISEVMLQQTTVNTVKNRYKKFLKRFPDIFILSQSSSEEVLEEWAGLGYYSRARNLHIASKIIVDKFNGKIPSDEKNLISLPGIGAYISGAIRAIAFNKKALAVDVNAERIITRFYNLKSKTEFKKISLSDFYSLIPESRPGDFAEAIMDLGSMICKKLNPICTKCPLKMDCKSFKNLEFNTISKKKKYKKSRNGKCFVIKRNIDDKMLFVRNPTKGLLGGMLSFPSYGWFYTDQDAILKKRINAYVKNLSFKKNKKTMIFHEFSHFKLNLKIYYAETYNLDLENGIWIHVDVAKDKLPTLMKKVIIKLFG